MRKKRAALVAGLSAVVVGFFCWLAFRSLEPEPAHQGKPLSFWLSQYQQYFLTARGDPEHAAKSEEARNAIRQMGTNALPSLLRMVRSKDSALKKNLLFLAQKQSLIRLRLRSADNEHARASYVFSALGAAAKPAVPALIECLHDPDPGVRACATHSLTFIGPEAEQAVPALLPLLDDRNNGIVLMEAMMALGSIGSQPEVVVPKLVEFVDGPRKEWNYPYSALDALARYGEKAKSALPAVRSALDDPNQSIKDSAFHALWRIDREAAAEFQRERARVNSQSH